MGQLVARLRMFSSEGVVSHERRTTMNVNTKALSPARRWLLHRMHQTNHGTMQDVLVRAGEPIIDPPPKIKQAFKLGSRQSGPKLVARDFELKEQQVELLDLLDTKQNGTISKLVIQHGLPFLVEWEDQ